LARPTTLSSIERYGWWLEDGRRDNPGWKGEDKANEQGEENRGHEVNGEFNNESYKEKSSSVVKLPQDEARDERD